MTGTGHDEFTEGIIGDIDKKTGEDGRKLGLESASTTKTLSPLFSVAIFPLVGRTFQDWICVCVSGGHLVARGEGEQQLVAAGGGIADLRPVRRIALEAGDPHLDRVSARRQELDDILQPVGEVDRDRIPLAREKVGDGIGCLR